ncbi:serine protease [Kitasatospora sp. MMS16-BH015]|uniref:trypsin-like serine peptidase n=1 Tax=Kitasatospora sp. MMS16-BH015 TaxID=2018025 RepID=UPI000CA17194|nr:serine protease [Kitasatospora sp. MMS16-BH015]AUG77029.1 serine protease [Kitasatospora sp. MMS16-BH015]
MKKPLIGALTALLLAGATALAGAAPASAAAPAQAAPDKAAPAVTVNFAGTVALSDCSGSVVRMPNSVSTDPALVLTNGHCLETGMPNPGQVIVNQSSSRSFTLLSASGGRLGTLRASKVAYSTMTDTDVTIYQLTSTYASIQSKYGISPLTISTAHPTAGAAIKVVSGYWKTVYSCNVDGFVYQLHEGGWVWKDSLRYTSACNTIGGTSGSPVIDTSTGLLVAVNNTGNENGERCTVNNPCEVDANGNVTIRQGINYAEETYGIPACFGTGNKLNLAAAGCTLPKP